MARTVYAPPRHQLKLPHINSVTLDNPWHWLAAGWHDLMEAPMFALLYGVAFTLFGYLLALAATGFGPPGSIPMLVAAFPLVAPLLAVGLYEVSRRRLEGEAIQTKAVLTAWRRNRNIGMMGLILLVTLVAWVNISAMTIASFSSGLGPTADGLLPQFIVSGMSGGALPAFLIIGALFAAFVYAISVVSFPMLLDRPRVNVFRAMLTSLATVSHNPRPMALWAVLIAALTGVGLLSYLIGLIVILPWIGFASFHAYRDLVGEDEPS